MDILFQDPIDGIKVALGNSSNDASFNTVFFTEFIITSNDDPNCIDQNVEDVVSIPNSNAFIDLDGDCLPDLFLTMTNGKNSYYRTYA